MKVFLPGWGTVLLGYEEEGQRYEAGVLRGNSGAVSQSLAGPAP